MTVVVLTGLLMTIPFLLAFVGISLWMTLRRPGIAPGHPQAANCNDHPADAVTDPWAGAEDDTDLDYYDTPSGNIWRLDAQPGRAEAPVL